ncbi:MAG: BON domain-containing protein [Cyanobacteria bacterium P01_D01_bin.44]
MDDALFLLFLVLITLTPSLLVIKHSRQIQRLLSLFSLVFLTFLGGLRPAIAEPMPVFSTLANSIEQRDQNICQFEENIAVSSSGETLEGFCIAQGYNGSQNDADIAHDIKAHMLQEDDLVVRVDNRAVFLSGAVNNEEAAKQVIQQIEKVPGVQWITANLTFKKAPQRTTG